MLPAPTKRPTPSEYAVIAVVTSGGLVVLGTIALVAAFRAPSEKHDVALLLIHYGGWSLGIGLFIGFMFWLVRRVTG